MQPPLSPSLLETLADLSTPTISNAIETFKIRLRTEGYINNTIACRLPKLKPMVGYAVTIRMRTDGPPTKGMSYPDRSDWWDTLGTLPGPKIVVIQDADKPAGIGSVAGEIHGAIFKALGCVGIVTNGAVRDLDALNAMQMHIYSGSLSPSHAYAHMIDVGAPVDIGGTIIRNGDLLHGDQHGIVTIPHQIAPELHVAALKILNHERSIAAFCASPEFSIEKLRTMVGSFNRMDEEHR